MSSWKKVAQEQFPGEVIEDKTQLYISIARKMLNRALSFEASMDKEHQGFVGLQLVDETENVLKRAAKDALETAAYSVGVRAFYADTANNNEHRLYDLIEEIDCQ